jgi:hypothetical protein
MEKRFRLYRQRFNRMWPATMKLRILEEVAEARRLDNRDGTVGRVKAVCDRYYITTAWITTWEKQFAKIIDEAAEERRKDPNLNLDK